MTKTVYIEGPEKCYFENNHAIGAELLEMMLGVYEILGNPRPERSLDNNVVRIDLVVPAELWGQVNEKIRVFEKNIAITKTKMKVLVCGKEVLVTVAESYETAKSFHLDVWQRKLRDETGAGGGGGDNGKALAALESKIESLQRRGASGSRAGTEGQTVGAEVEGGGL